MMLMPPTNATAASPHAIFLCMRRSRPRFRFQGLTSGRNTSTSAPAARRRASERIRDQAPGLVVGEEVALDEHLLARAIERRDERGKVALAVLEQRQPVTADVAHCVAC